MSSQTLRRAKTLEEFREVFVGRIDALAAAYMSLSRQSDGFSAFSDHGF